MNNLSLLEGQGLCPPTFSVHRKNIPVIKDDSIGHVNEAPSLPAWVREILSGNTPNLLYQAHPGKRLKFHKIDPPVLTRMSPS